MLNIHGFCVHLNVQSNLYLILLTFYCTPILKGFTLQQTANFSINLLHAKAATVNPEPRTLKSNMKTARRWWESETACAHRRKNWLMTNSSYDKTGQWGCSHKADKCMHRSADAHSTRIGPVYMTGNFFDSSLQYSSCSSLIDLRVTLA